MSVSRRFDVNLASRPFENNVLPWTAYGLLVLIGILFTWYNVSSWLAASNPRAFMEVAARRLYRFVVSEHASLKLRAITNAQRGGLPAERRALYPSGLVAALSPMLGIDAPELELTIQTMTFVMMQYALLGEDDVVLITGQGGDVGRRTLEDHVVRVALRLVFPAP